MCVLEKLYFTVSAMCVLHIHYFFRYKSILSSVKFYIKILTVLVIQNVSFFYRFCCNLNKFQYISINFIYISINFNSNKLQFDFNRFQFDFSQFQLDFSRFQMNFSQFQLDFSRFQMISVDFK